MNRAQKKIAKEARNRSKINQDESFRKSRMEVKKAMKPKKA